jgi:predicted RND superfamily exporter protein
VHRLILRHHRLILWLSGLLTLAALMLCTRLRLDLNFLSLLPPHNPQVRTFLNVSEKIGLQSLLIAVVKPADSPGRTLDTQTAEAFIDLLAAHYQNSALVQEVEYKRDDVDLMQFLPLLLRRLPQLLSPEELVLLPGMVSDDAIREKVAENKNLLLTPFGFAAKQMVLADPLGFGELLQHSMRLPSKSIIQKGHDGYYSDDQGQFFIFIKPKKPPEDIVFSKQLMQEMAVIEQAALKEAQTAIPDLKQAPVIAYTGGYPIAVNDEAVTKKDIQLTLVSSIVGVLVLFGLCFRTAKTLVQVSVPLLMSISWTMGLAQLLFGQLNLLTCIFSCVLAGLGIDFAIHIVNRFHSAERIGLPLNERLEGTFRETGAGIIIGALTTAAAFYAVSISDFKGFQELGIMTGSGLLLCLVAMLFVLPALLVHSQGKAQRPVSLAGFSLPPLFRTMKSRPWPFVLTVSAISLSLLIIGLQVRFDDNLKNFRAPDNQALRLQEQITQWLGGSSAAALLVVSNPSEEAVLNTSADIWRSLRQLKESGNIADVGGLPAFFPAPSKQQQNLAFIRANQGIFDWHRIRDTFNEALAANGLQPQAAYDDYFNLLQAAFNDKALFFPSHLIGTVLQPLMQMFLFTAENQTHEVIYVRPKSDLWSREDTARFRQTLEDHLSQAGIPSDQYILTGAPMLSAALKAVILDNLQTDLILAVAAILVILLIYYRSLFLLLGALLPLAASLGMLAGIMSLLKLDFNFVNVIVLPMIVGIGIDDGVHLTNNFLADGHIYRADTLARTGRGVVLTSLTTMVGFGSIALSHYPGLRSIGYVAVIGVGAGLFTSLLLLPSVLAIVGKRDISA